MAAEGGHGELTSSSYIEHHLQNLQVCKDEAGAWVWNQISLPCDPGLGSSNNTVAAVFGDDLTDERSWKPNCCQGWRYNAT